MHDVHRVMSMSGNDTRYSAGYNPDKAAPVCPSPLPEFWIVAAPERLRLRSPKERGTRTARKHRDDAADVIWWRVSGAL
jgi:hypothetical protein